jgi:Lrp/AsnC family transcriptional regulator, regulator for asnA, asnC and gidA
MDEIDEKIIQILTADARTSFRQMAKDLGKSPDTIIKRYERLREEGKIRGSTVVVEPRRIGYEGMAAFHIDVSVSSGAKTDSTSILRALIKMPNIIVATKTVGDHDLLAIGVIHDFNHLMKLGKEIAAITGVKNIQTALWAGRDEVCPKYFII